MRIITRGDEPAELAVVGSLHADEREGAEAINRLIPQLSVSRPTKFLVVTDSQQDTPGRESDPDLNRVFGKSGDTAVHEIAEEVLDEVGDCRVLDLHTTEATDEPFAILQQITDTKRELAAITGVDRVVDASELDDGLVAQVEGVAVECGLKHDGPDVNDASVETACKVTRRFLAANDATDGEQVRSDPTVYRIYDTISRPATEGELVIRVENFERVETGEEWLETDGKRRVASESFCPVLLSPSGYDDKLGYKAERVGALSEYRGE